MERDDLACWEERFVAFQDRFAHLFARSEVRRQAGKYLRGLLSATPRKNGWRLAEVIGDATPDRTQRLLYSAHWDADAARDVLQRFVIETFGDPQGIVVLDETGFPKKGHHSVGVQRQYCGRLGRVSNCQVATVLSYCSVRGHVWWDRRLYLPREWATDRSRRAQAKVPPEVPFQSKPEQATAMLEHAWAQGLPLRWVVGDEVYGGSTLLRDRIAQQGSWYLLAVPADTQVWAERPLGGPPWVLGKPQSKTTHLAAGVPPATTVSAVIAAQPPKTWTRVVVEGEQGPHAYDWACQRVVERRADRPGPAAWLLVRRTVGPGPEWAYYLSNAPSNVTLPELARVAPTRFSVEQCLQESKGVVGLAAYAVRDWPSWQRHITLCMMAHTWLASIRLEVGEKGLHSRPGRTQCGGSVPVVRDRVAAAAPLECAALGLVALATGQTPKSAAQSSETRPDVG